MHPSKIAKSFWGYSFIIFNTVLSPKRRNPLYEWAKSALKPQSDERAGEIHGDTVRRKRQTLSMGEGAAGAFTLVLSYCESILSTP